MQFLDGFCLFSAKIVQKFGDRSRRMRVSGSPKHGKFKFAIEFGPGLALIPVCKTTRTNFVRLSPFLDSGRCKKFELDHFDGVFPNRQNALSSEKRQELSPEQHLESCLLICANLATFS